MKKLLIIFNLLLLVIISGCSNKTSDTKKESETFIYKSESGDLTVPTNPQRIVVLNSSLSGHVLALKGKIVGIDKWSKNNPTFLNLIKDIPEVSDENLEQIIELNPDLIIAATTDKNIDKLKSIAPTVSYTYGKVDYLTQFIEIGKLLNKEEEAKNWVKDFTTRAQEIGKQIKSKIGETATVAVIESYDKQLYVFGRNFARGTEILYNEMKLKMPPKVEADADKTGYYAISSEVLPEFVGDYNVFSKNQSADNSFQHTKTYKNLDAVKNNRVFEADGRTFFFNDPITLENQLEFFKKSFLNN